MQNILLSIFCSCVSVSGNVAHLTATEILINIRFWQIVDWDEYSATSAIVVSVHLLNGGSLSCQYSQRRNWSQSAAGSWTWAPAALGRPAACTASASSLPWTGLQRTCSFLPNETRPAAGADRRRGPGSWWRGSGRAEGEFGRCFSDLQNVNQTELLREKVHTNLIKNLRSHKMLYATVWWRNRRTFQIRNKHNSCNQFLKKITEVFWPVAQWCQIIQSRRTVQNFYWGWGHNHLWEQSHHLFFLLHRDHKMLNELF